MRQYLTPCPVCEKPGTVGYSHYDGHCIFLFYACEKCYRQKIKGYRSDIMDRYQCDEPIDGD